MTSSDICEVSLSLRPKIRAQTCLPFAGQRYASSALPRYASRPTEVPCYNWLRRDAPRGCKYRKQLECLQGERVQIRGGTISFHTGKGQHWLFRDQTGCIISKGGKCQDTVQTRPQGSLNRLLGILRIIRLVLIQKTHFYLIERKYYFLLELLNVDYLTEHLDGFASGDPGTGLLSDHFNQTQQYST